MNFLKIIIAFLQDNGPWLITGWIILLFILLFIGMYSASKAKDHTANNWILIIIVAHAIIGFLMLALGVIGGSFF